MFHDLDNLRQRRSTKWVEHPPDVLPAFVAEMDVQLAEPIRDALHEAIELGDLGYTEAGGLLDACAAFMTRRLGWTPDPARMQIVPDVMTGIVEVLRALAPGAGVVINTPVYPPFFPGIAEAGCEVVEVPLAAGELDLDGIDRAFAGGARALLLCNPHNPTGRVLAPDRLADVAALAARHDALIVADEIHGPLALPGARHTPLGALGDSRSVVLTSASKAFNLAGLKCAISIAGSDEIAEQLAARFPDELRYRAGMLGVIGSQAAFVHGDAWLDDLLGRLDANRRLLAALLAERLPAIGYRPPDASFLAWLDCRALGLGDDPAAAFLERGRVALVAGPDFGAPGRGFARLNLGTSAALITEAVDRMAAATRAAPAPAPAPRGRPSAAPPPPRP